MLTDVAAGERLALCSCPAIFTPAGDAGGIAVLEVTHERGCQVLAALRRGRPDEVGR